MDRPAHHFLILEGMADLRNDAESECLIMPIKKSKAAEGTHTNGMAVSPQSVPSRDQLDSGGKPAANLVCLSSA